MCCRERAKSCSCNSGLRHSSCCKQGKAIHLREGGQEQRLLGDARRRVLAKRSEDSKVIVRSNGTVTYVGKDIAYQLWKFGLLGKGLLLSASCDYDKWPKSG